MESVEGIVTYKNEELLYFKIDNIFVNAAIYLVNQLSAEVLLPDVGQKLNIKNAHQHKDVIKGDNVLSLCHKSKCAQFKVPASQGLHYLWTVKDYKLGSGDLLTVTKMYESVKDTVPSEIKLADVVLKYIEDIFVNSTNKISEIVSCKKNSIPSSQFKTISQCKYIQLRGDAYSKFPYWSFGNNWSLTGELLIGYVFVHPKFGTICLKDEFYTVGCIVIKNHNTDISDVINKTVYITKYCIFTEIFNPNTKFNLEYLVFDYNNLKVVEKKRKREYKEPFLKYKLEFLLISKSYVTFSQIRSYHFWLQIEEVNGTYLNENKKCFLCLPSTFIENWPCLELSYTYTIWFHEHLQRIYDSEYTRINPNLAQYYISQNASAEISPRGYFTRSQDLPFLDGITLPQLSEQKGLISFQAILKYRKFNPANNSRTKSSNLPPCFGTLGKKAHILDFQVENVKTLILYLNNWERIIMPVGLIPGVLVNVRNVIFQKNYCKSTPLTSFEIVEYQPKYFMQTAKLLSDEDWGEPYFLGDLNIPTGALVFSIINFFYVNKLSLTRCCSKCSYVSKLHGNLCIKCQSSIELSCKFIIHINDHRGPAKIIINEPEVISVFLGLDESEWLKWKNSFETVGQYYFHRKINNVDCSVNKNQLEFINLTSQLLMLNEKKPFVNIGMLCRKMYMDKNHPHDPLWFGLQARMVN